MTETAVVTANDVSDPEAVRASMLAAIAAERAAWQATVAEVGPDRMLLPGAMGDWSFRDLADHLTGWRERTIARLRTAAGQPEPPTPWPADLADDDDAVNDWLLARRRDWPVDRVLAAADASYGEVAAVVATLPAADLVDPDRFGVTEGRPLGEVVLDGSLFGHWHEEHEADVRAWLATNPGRTG